jgi:PA-IL-like protein
MSMKKLWLVPLALACGAAYASPDTLYMEDGRRIRGELISANNSVIVFSQDDGNFSQARRIRVNRADVSRIDFTDGDNSYYGDDDIATTAPGRWGNRNGTGRDILVRGDQAWTDTGVRLSSGETFRIDASGFVNWGPNRNDDPNGEASSPYNANRPLPNRAGGALIARIGNGQPFFVGSGMQSFRASTSGPLYLGINDDFLRDNSGSFRVIVNPR